MSKVSGQSRYALANLLWPNRATGGCQPSSAQCPLRCRTADTDLARCIVRNGHAQHCRVCCLMSACPSRAVIGRKRIKVGKKACPGRFDFSGAARGNRFVDQEKIREQRTKVDRRVEIVDELRSDRPL